MEKDDRRPPSSSVTLETVQLHTPKSVACEYGWICHRAILAVFSRGSLCSGKTAPAALANENSAYAVDCWHRVGICHWSVVVAKNADTLPWIPAPNNRSLGRHWLVAWTALKRASW